MKLVVSKQDISKIMQISQNIVEKKSTMPILQNALLEANGNMLTISSSDMQITIIAKISANVITEGKTTINANLFANMVRELPDEDVLLEVEEGEILSITSGKTVSKILGISAESFPKFPTSDIKAAHKIKANVLSDMINKTSFAVSNDETRWSLNGVCFQKDVIKNEKGKNVNVVKAVATDGHRLAIVTREIDMPFLSSEIIVPKKGIFELKKILDEAGENEISLDVTDSLIVVETQNIKMGMRLIDAKYPDYSMAVQEGDGILIEFDTNTIVNSMKRMTLMNSDKDKKMILHFENKLLTITSVNPGVGEAKDEIEIEYKEKEPLDLGFNPKYLLDLVSNLGGEKVVFQVFGKAKPIKIFSPKDTSAIAYLMPMRIRAS